MGRRPQKLTYGGRSQTAAQWAKELGISEQALWDRLGKRGWPVWLALSVPARNVKKEPRNPACKNCRFSKITYQKHGYVYCDYLDMMKTCRPCSYKDCRGWPKKKEDKKK